MTHPGELLARCLQREPAAATSDALRRLAPVGWEQLVDVAEWHGVGPLLDRGLHRFPDVVPPESARNRLRDLYLHSLIRNEAIKEQLAQLLQAIAGAGYHVLALKGAVLARVAYADAALRPMYDLDLLASDADAEAVYGVVGSLGYAPVLLSEPFAERHHLHPMGRDDGVSIEVHRALAPVDSPFLRDLSGFWSRATHSRVGSVDMPHPALDDVLVHLCVHAACNHELEMPLLALCDIDALIVRLGDRLPWPRLVATANGAGVGHFVYVMLRMTEGALQTPVPADVLASLHHDAGDDAVATLATDHLLGRWDEVPTMISDLARAETVGGRLRALWRSVFPPLERLRKIYELPDGSVVAPLYYLYRPFDLVIRRGGWLVDMMTGGRASAKAVAHERRMEAMRAWSRRADGASGSPPRP